MHLHEGRGREGNLVLVEVMTNTGFRTSIENQYGKDLRIKKGDYFIGVLANRHSGTSESGSVPKKGMEIRRGTKLSLLAAGALLGRKTGIPGKNKKDLLQVRALGLVTHNGKPAHLIDISGGHHTNLNQSAPIILVCGTSAEVGKTTTAAALVKACKKEGLRVAGTKLAGTGRMRDITQLRNAGADPCLDFPDVGLASTYTHHPQTFIRGIYTLLNTLNMHKPDIIIAEAGGDPIESNIPALLKNRAIMNYVTAVVIVAGDVMGMMGAVSYIRPSIPHVPFFLTEPKGRNSYTTRERIKRVLPGLSMFDSLNQQEVRNIVRHIVRKRRIVRSS